MDSIPHPTYFYPVTLLVAVLRSNVEFKIVQTQMKDLRGTVTELKSSRGLAFFFMVFFWRLSVTQAVKNRAEGD